MSDNGEPLRLSDSFGEYARFGALVVVLLTVLAVVTLFRPLVFKQMIPTVLGWDLPMVSVPVPEKAGPLSQPVAVEEPIAAEPAPPTEQLVLPTPTLVTIFHNVAPGENLHRIADIYGLSVEEIISTNDIANPNRIRAGTVLLIPQP